jgi:hypothetical protein
MQPREHADDLIDMLKGLSRSQRAWIRAFVRQFRAAHAFERLATSGVVTDTVLENIGDLLRIHHAMSRRPLSKAPFEYALEKALQLAGQPAKLADSSTNPGYDLMLGAERISLKTEAAKSTKADQLHVSKWMEMGKGVWNPPAIQMPRFIEHLGQYDRILTLRCLQQTATHYGYELVEIPKALMLEAVNGRMEKAAKTRQETWPWYCHVADGAGGNKYSLYFDAGSERKLQVKGLMKKYCVVHATWRFESLQLVEEGPADAG